MKIWWGMALPDWVKKTKQQLRVQVWLNSCWAVVLQHRKPGFTLALEGVRHTRRRWMLLVSPCVQSLFLHTHRGKQEMQQGVMWNRFDYSVANCFALPSTAADQHAAQDIVSWRERERSSWTALRPENSAGTCNMERCCCRLGWRGKCGKTMENLLTATTETW